MNNIKRKKISQDPQSVPENNPFVDQAYIGDTDFLASQIMERFDVYKKARAIWDPYIYESIAFDAGKQNMWWNPAANTLQYVLPPDPSQTQAVVNRILSKRRAIVARMTSFSPTAQVIPNSSDETDVYGARVGKKILESNYYNLGWEEVYTDFAEFVVVEGMGWLKTVFDEFGGKCNIKYKVQPSFVEIQQEAKQEGQSEADELGEWLNNPSKERTENGEDGVSNNAPVGSNEQPATPGAEVNAGESVPGGQDAVPQGSGDVGEGGTTDTPQPTQKQSSTIKIQRVNPDTNEPVYEPIMDDEGNPVIDEYTFDGSVDKRALGPMSMFYNPTVMKWKDCFDVIEVNYLSVDEIKTMFPNCQDLSDSDTEPNSMNPWAMIFGTTIDRNPYGNTIGIPVYEYYCKSCPSFPRGLRVIIIKDKIRLGGPMPTLNGDRLPYSFAKYISIPGTMRGMSLGEYLKNPQTIRNKMLSQQVDNARLFAVPRVLASSETKFSDKITNGVQIVYYQGGTKPDFINPQALSSAHKEIIDLMDSDIDTLSGVNKTAEGNPPPNVTSGEMSEAVTENDYQVHLPDITRVVNAIADSCSVELRLVQDKSPEEILARFIGSNGQLYAKKFKKAVLRNNFDVRIQAGKMGNMSRAQQMNFIKTVSPMVMNNTLSEKHNAVIGDKIIEWLMWGEEDSLVDEINKQENSIAEIISEIENSGKDPNYQVHPMPFDDLDVWKKSLEDKLIMRSYINQLPDIVKNRLMTLWQEVTMMQNQLQQNAMAKVQGAAGGPPPPGGGPPPPGSQSGPPQPTPPASADLQRSAAIQQMNDARIPASAGQGA